MRIAPVVSRRWTVESPNVVTLFSASPSTNIFSPSGRVRASAIVYDGKLTDTFTWVVSSTPSETSAVSIRTTSRCRRRPPRSGTTTVYRPTGTAPNTNPPLASDVARASVSSVPATTSRTPTPCSATSGPPGSRFPSRSR
jgi:hypothetical protein